MKRFPSSHGGLFLALLTDDRVRVLRYGSHRRNNPRNWTRPKGKVRIVWVGWRDDETGNFIRPEQVVKWQPVKTS